MSNHRHNHIGAPGRTTGSGSRLFITILINIIITLAEFIGGLLSGYLALIADAFHNLSDVAALILAYLGEKSAHKPPTLRSTYGFRRIEVITAFISAVSLVVIAGYIFYEAYRRFLNPIDLTNPGLILIIAGIGLAGNMLSVFFLHSSRHTTLNLKAAFLHMLYDTLSSAAVIIGAVIIMKTGLVVIDPILSVIIGVMIIWSSFDVLKEATMIFMEAAPRHIAADEVMAEIKRHPQVVDVHHLHIWSLSSSMVALSCHICLSHEDFMDSPRVIRELGMTLNEKFKIGHITIQPEIGLCPDDNHIWIL